MLNTGSHELYHSRESVPTRMQAYGKSRVCRSAPACIWARGVRVFSRQPDRLGQLPL